MSANNSAVQSNLSPQDQEVHAAWGKYLDHIGTCVDSSGHAAEKLEAQIVAINAKYAVLANDTARMAVEVSRGDHDHHFLTHPLAEEEERGSMLTTPWRGKPHQVDGHPLLARPRGELRGIEPRPAPEQRLIEASGVHEGRGDGAGVGK